MKKVFFAFLAGLLIGVAAVITCPDKQAHKDAIMSVINERINDEMKVDNPDYQGFLAMFSRSRRKISTRQLTTHWQNE